MSLTRLKVSRIAAITVMVISAMGCATRHVPMPSGTTSEPRASWVIRAGEYTHEQEVCRSDTGPVCVLPASSDARPVSVTVAVYLFPAGAPTTYRGAFMSGFVGNSPKGFESTIAHTVKPGHLPVGVTVTGRVTTVPGEYPFRMTLLAEVPGHTDPHQFQDTFAVRVVSSAASGE